jgi:hypothetical protein
MKTYTYLRGVIQMHTLVYGAALTNSRGETLVEFLYSSILEIQNQGNEPPFSSGSRLEVTDIALGSHGLVESIID